MKPGMSMAGTTRRGGVPEIVTDNLVWHLDFSDPACYPGSGQWIYDLTANSYDMHVGNTASAEGNDPTYAGTAPAHFAFDGSDVIDPPTDGSYAGSTLRKFGRQDQEFTLECWALMGNTTTDTVLFSNMFAGSHHGLYFMWSGAANARLQTRFFPADSSTSNGTDISAGAWHQFAISGRTNGSSGIFVVDGAQDGTWTHNASGFTSGESEYGPFLMSRAGDHAFLSPNGTKLAKVRAYDVALNAEQLAQNFAAQRSQFGI